VERTKPPGARTLRLPDWPYGAVGRRMLLETLLLDAVPEGGWTKTDLEKAADAEPGGIDAVLAGAVAWQLIERQSTGRWHRVEPAPAIVEKLVALLTLTRSAPNDDIPALPRRAYTPRAGGRRTDNARKRGPASKRSAQGRSP
jgi:hypothetical protein